MPTNPTPITALPTAPSREDPANFPARADAFLGALGAFGTQTNAVAAATYTNAVEATSAATTATTQATTATTAATTATTQASAAADSAAAALVSANTAAALAGAFTGTSTTSLTIGTGNKTFTTQAGEQYTAGIYLIATSAATPSAFMFGQVTSYSGTSLVLNVQATGGSGTYADWNLSLAGVRGAPGTGITDQATGFSATGGTSARTLTVDQDLVASRVVNEVVQVISANTTAVVETRYVLTASLTLTLPASPAVNSRVSFSNRSGTTTATIARNGQPIMGLAEDMTLDTTTAAGTLIYADATRGWVLA